MFLVETWLDKVRLEEIRSKMKFGGMIEVCRDMRRGGGNCDFLEKRMLISHWAPFLQTV